MACSSNGANDRRRLQLAKIQGLDQVVAKIAGLADEYGIEGLLENANEEYGVIPTGDFADVVDQENPHASLAAMTETVERRYAYVVMNYIRQIPIGFDEVCDMITELGASLAPEGHCPIAEMYAFMNDRILDGMPCDKTKEVFKQTDTEIIWSVVVDTHKEIWEEAFGDVMVYYELLGCFISSLISKAGYVYDQPASGLHRIKKA